MNCSYEDIGMHVWVKLMGSIHSYNYVIFIHVGVWYFNKMDDCPGHLCHVFAKILHYWYGMWQTVTKVLLKEKDIWIESSIFFEPAYFVLNHTTETFHRVSQDMNYIFWTHCTFMVCRHSNSSSCSLRWYVKKIQSIWNHNMFQFKHVLLRIQAHEIDKNMTISFQDINLYPWKQICHIWSSRVMHAIECDTFIWKNIFLIINCIL